MLCRVLRLCFASFYQILAGDNNKQKLKKLQESHCYYQCSANVDFIYIS